MKESVHCLEDLLMVGYSTLLKTLNQEGLPLKPILVVSFQDGSFEPHSLNIKPKQNIRKEVKNYLAGKTGVTGYQFMFQTEFDLLGDKISYTMEYFYTGYYANLRTTFLEYSDDQYHFSEAKGIKIKQYDSLVDEIQEEIAEFNELSKEPSQLDYKSLEKAIEEESVVKLKALIDSGHDINQTNDWGETVLMDAASRGFVEGIEFILTQNPNINHRCDLGNTALSLAIWSGSTKGLDLLLKHGAQFDPIDIHNLAFSNENGTTIDEFIEVLNQNQVSYDLNHRDSAGYTPLLRACSEANDDNILDLIKHGADVHITGPNSENCLHLLTAFESSYSKKLIQKLIDLGADLDQKTQGTFEAFGVEFKAGSTPLDIAYRIKSTDIIQLLEERAALKSE